MKKTPSIRKILQALYYLQSKAPSDNPDRFNRTYLLKLVYLADRYHARHYGGLMTNDTYYAMSYGPVAETTYNILKKEQFNITYEDISLLSAITGINEYDIRIAKQGEEALSVSSKKALDFALSEFGSYTWRDLSEITHYYPEWVRHRSEVQSKPKARVNMRLVDFFDDPENPTWLKRFGKNCDPYKEDKDTLAAMKEIYYENAAVSI